MECHSDIHQTVYYIYEGDSFSQCSYEMLDLC